MKINEIEVALADLANTSRILEETYIENGGEITEQTEVLADQEAALKVLLTTEGVDSLGRWLKSKEDEKQAWKNEKAVVEARIKSVDKTIDFIKTTVGRVLRATGEEKVKGKFYSFAQYDSRKTAVLTDAIDDAFLDAMTEAARDAGLPGCIDIALKTNATRLTEWADTHEGEYSTFLQETVEPTAKFTKPRAAKE